REPVPAGFEPRAPLAVVVDLAVAHEHERAVRARHRLVAGLQIDDREPAKAEAEAALEKKPVRIRTAMDELPRHLPQRVDGRWPPVGEIEKAGDAAHAGEWFVTFVLLTLVLTIFCAVSYWVAT